MSRNSFPDAPDPGRKLIDARLQLLDRQLLDADDNPVGIVDDLQLSGVETGAEIPVGAAAPQISAILTGQVLVTRILGGKPYRVHLTELPWRDVADIGTTVHLRVSDVRNDALWIEEWLRDNVIGRIPGGRHASE